MKLALPTVLALGVILTVCQTATSESTEYRKLTPQEVELSGYVERYLDCGAVAAKGIALEEPELARVDIVPIAEARCRDLEAQLYAKSVEIEGPKNAPRMRIWSATDFRLMVESAAGRVRVEHGLPEL